MKIVIHIYLLRTRMCLELMIGRYNNNIYILRIIVWTDIKKELLLSVSVRENLKYYLE